MTDGSFAAKKFIEANQTVVRVKGGHFLQESSGPEVGKAVADFVRGLRR